MKVRLRRGRENGGRAPEDNSLQFGEKWKFKQEMGVLDRSIKC